MLPSEYGRDSRLHSDFMNATHFDSVLATPE
jgi:hypothetical protein